MRGPRRQEADARADARGPAPESPADLVANLAAPAAVLATFDARIGSTKNVRLAGVPGIRDV
ncbi:MAG: hypothetical protein ACFB50_03070 [Rubrobacteraceae bacterium]